MSDLKLTEGDFVYNNVFEYTPPFDTKLIQRILPHRPPFLLVDGITELTVNTVTGFKNLSINEDVFRGHFPGEPVYPGVLQIETVAQVGACWILSRKEQLGKIVYLMKVEEAKFRKPAVPGMQLWVRGTITDYRISRGRLESEIRNGGPDGEVLSNITVLFALPR